MKGKIFSYLSRRDLFVVRVAGNVASDEEVGSLEFETLVLGAKVLLVLGHERCGAVKAAIDNKPVPDKIGSILKHIKPTKVATQNSPEALLKETTSANIKDQISTLKSSTVLTDLIKSGKLKIIGGFYDLDTRIMTQVA